MYPVDTKATSRTGPRLYRRVFAVAGWFVEREHGRLRPVAESGVRRPVNPAVKARLVLPVVILATEHQRVLDHTRHSAAPSGRLRRSSVEIDCWEVVDRVWIRRDRKADTG